MEDLARLAAPVAGDFLGACVVVVVVVVGFGLVLQQTFGCERSEPRTVLLAPVLGQQ